MLAPAPPVATGGPVKAAAPAFMGHVRGWLTGSGAGLRAQRTVTVERRKGVLRCTTRAFPLTDAAILGLCDAPAL